jgi:hypothetical protein
MNLELISADVDFANLARMAASIWASVIAGVPDGWLRGGREREPCA